MSNSPWKRASHWLAAMLLGISLLPSVAAADGDAVAANGSIERLTAKAAAAMPPVIAAGFSHSLLVQPGGSVWAWGQGYEGQLGAGNTVDTATPVLVRGLGTSVKSVAAGPRHSLALGADGAVWAWGDNSHGEVPGGGGPHIFTPVKLETVAGVSAIAAGDGYSLALKSGTVLAWGANDSGQLGQGRQDQMAGPVTVRGLSGVVAIAAGGQHVLALTADGAVWAWGANLQGQLGDGSRLGRSTPVKVPGLPRVTQIAAGEGHSFALAADGTLWGWGMNDWQQLIVHGDNFYTVPVKAMTNVSLVAAGGSHTLVRKTDGTLWASGYNEDGQLGYYRGSGPMPLQIDLPGVAALAAGSRHSLAAMADGTVMTWGRHQEGERGNGWYGEGSSAPSPIVLGLELTSPLPGDDVVRVSRNPVTFTGITFPKAKVTAEIAGKLLSTTADAAGAFTFKNVTVPSDTEAVLTLTATNARNPDGLRTYRVSLDNKAPEVTQLSLQAGDGRATPHDVPLTRDGTTFSGTVTATDSLVLSLTGNEPLSGVLVNPAPKKIVQGFQGAVITLGALKKGVNKVTVELTDLAGLSTRLTLLLTYETGPILKVTEPTSNVITRGPGNGADTVRVKFSGSSDERVTELLVVDAANDSPLPFPTTVTPGFWWTATVDFPATQPGTWQVRLVGKDAQGYYSPHSPTRADIRTVVIDPVPPQLSSSVPIGGMIMFTDGKDGHFGVANQRLPVHVEAYDEHAGLKQLTVGTTMRTASASDPHHIRMDVALPLRDQKLNLFPVVAEDMAGNKESKQIAMLLKSRINTLSASGTWWRPVELMRVTGATDPAFNLATREHPWWVASVPLEVRANGLLLRSLTAGRDGCYDRSTGQFACNVGTESLPAGTYRIDVVALPPEEFPGLQRKVVSFQLTIRR